MAVSGEDTEGDDWAAQLTARLEHFVALLRDHSVRPARSVVRILIFGAVALILGTVALAATSIGVFRVLDDDAFNHRVWITDLVFGGMLFLAGAFLLSKSVKRGRNGGQ